MLLSISIAVLALVAIGVALGTRKKPSANRSATPAAPKAPTVTTPSQATPRVPAPSLAAVPPPPAHSPASNREVPETLRQLRFKTHQQLAPHQAQTLTERLRSIPRPPNALDKLVSAEFLSKATSAELNDLMVGEPQIAAKVLASVNSPMYGLQRPLGSIGQAATYLGMNTVRGICLKYMLDASFQSTSPAIRASYNTLWNASVFSSELCFKLAQLLKFPEPGALVTQVVLSHLGPLATYSLIDNATLIAHSRLAPIARAQAEQALLGLCSAEIGSLLMLSWQLPESLVAEVRDIDHILTDVCPRPAHERSARSALCYLCNHLGAQLANRELSDLRLFELTSDKPELFNLQSYLRLPSLQRLPEYLRFPEVVTAVNQMAAAALVPSQPSIH